jgi:hypothetical protein
MASLGTSVRGGIVAMHIARACEGTAADGCMAAESGNTEGSDILLSRSGYIVVAG